MTNSGETKEKAKKQVRISEPIHRDAKSKAAKKGMTLSEYLESLVRKDNSKDSEKK